MIDIEKLRRDEKLELARTSTDINILNILAKDRDFYVRYGIARNSNTSAESLAMLAKDKYIEIRFCVVYNKNTSIKVLKELINDIDEDIKKAAINKFAELKGLNSFI